MARSGSELPEARSSMDRDAVGKALGQPAKEPRAWMLPIRLIQKCYRKLIIQTEYGVRPRADPFRSYNGLPAASQCSSLAEPMGCQRSSTPAGRRWMGSGSCMPVSSGGRIWG